jgi:hypothetical protein
MENKTYITIYRDGRLSRWDTYKPIIHDKLVTLGNRVDYWFTHYGEWPDNEQLLQYLQ